VPVKALALAGCPNYVREIVKGTPPLTRCVDSGSMPAAGISIGAKARPSTEGVVSTHAAFAAADWGTTRLRLWLLGSGGEVIAEQRSDEGLLSVARHEFEAVLERHLEALGAPADLPVIMCGMVGSRQGWFEAPYFELPARTDDVLSAAVRVPGIRREVRIIPGAALRNESRPDVMRGEETQLAGAAALSGGSALACMPGTHSKWAAMQGGVLADFSTWMTGELFSVISAHSILRHSTGGGEAAVDPASPAFAAWLEKALANPAKLTTDLFTIRASGLLFAMPQADAAAALSGLLIGAEIAAAKARYGGGSVMLIASGGLKDLYEAALYIAGCDVTTVDGEEVVRTGLTEAARRNFAAVGSEAIA
jgi:2-dehydro-3-deoxygalactonokinase